MTFNSILKTMYGLLKPLVPTLKQHLCHVTKNDARRLQQKVFITYVTLTRIWPNMSEVCHFINGLTKDLT